MHDTSERTHVPNQSRRRDDPLLLPSAPLSVLSSDLWRTQMELSGILPSVFITKFGLERCWGRGTVQRRVFRRSVLELMSRAKRALSPMIEAVVVVGSSFGGLYNSVVYGNAVGIERRPASRSSLDSGFNGSALRESLLLIEIFLRSSLDWHYVSSASAMYATKEVVAQWVLHAGGYGFDVARRVSPETLRPLPGPGRI